MLRPLAFAALCHPSRMAARSASSSAATQASDGRPRAAAARDRIPQRAPILCCESTGSARPPPQRQQDRHARRPGAQPKQLAAKQTRPASTEYADLAKLGSQRILAKRPLAARKRGRRSVARHAAARTRRREKRVFRTDRHDDRRVDEAAGLAAGESRVLWSRLRAALPSCSRGYFRCDGSEWLP